MPPKVILDFETASLAPLTAVGAWNYAKHPTTEILCLGYSIGHKEPKIWTAKGKTPELLLSQIKKGLIFEAHNSFFERAIWHHICHKRFGWPDIPLEQWSCTAARANMVVLPRKLEDLAYIVALDTPKDMEGHAIMKKYCTKTSDIFKSNKGIRKQLLDYCKQDVRVEMVCDQKIEPFHPFERKVWETDQAINWRGIHCDRELCEKALAIKEQASELLNGKLFELTGVERATQRARLLKWLQQYHQVSDTQAATIGYLYKHTEHPEVKKALGIFLAVNKTSSKKYSSALDYMDSNDDRVRNAFMYYGAGTGRWAGKGLQLHNFPRNASSNMDNACQEIIDLSIEKLFKKYSPEHLLVHITTLLRGMVKAPEGKTLLVADYSAIELWILTWLSQDWDTLKLLRKGSDLYIQEASSILKKAYEEITSEERFLGKVAILGLGYQMGAPRFWDYVGANNNFVFDKGLKPGHKPFRMKSSEEVRYDLSKLKFDKQDFQYNKAVNNEDIIRQANGDLNIEYYLFCRDIVLNYRKRHKAVPLYWRLVNEAAITAVLNPGKSIPVHYVAWKMKGDFLTCKLPSGRYLYYHSPQIESNQFGKPSLTYNSADTRGMFSTTYTFGGKLVENIVQAVARDKLAQALIDLEEDGTFSTVLHAHDEIVVEADIEKPRFKHFLNVINKTPKWMSLCPVKASGKTLNRWTKL